MFTHRHAEGGIYQYVGPQMGKDPESGEWLHGVCYKGTDNEMRWTTLQRWFERFEELPPSKFSDEKVIELKDDDGETIAQYAFKISEVDDVRFMFITAVNMAKKHGMHHVEKVMQAQADMVATGLHLRGVDFLDMMQDIVAFHQKFGLEYTGKPRVLDPELFAFRSKFIMEEFDEWKSEQSDLIVELGNDETDHRRIALGLHQQLDALVDLTYVVLGAAYLQFGDKIFREAWRRVQAANMAKVRCENAEDSKRGSTFDVIKPEGWTPPDHHDLVVDHAHRTYRKGNEDLNPNFKGDAIGT